MSSRRALRVAIDCDEAGVELKATLVEHLRAQGTDVTDLQFLAYQSGDYPEIGFALAQKVADATFDRGILICGTGLGMAMIANKIEGVWAGTCHDAYSAQRLKKSNDANVLTLGSRVVGSELAKMIVDAWLASNFGGGASSRKVQRLRDLERDSFRAGRREAF